MKPNPQNQKIVNCLSSDLSNLLIECPYSSEIIMECFYRFLSSANIDSDIIVEVLEKFNHIDVANEIILTIKITEGW